MPEENDSLDRAAQRFLIVSQISARMEEYAIELLEEDFPDSISQELYESYAEMMIHKMQRMFNELGV